MKNIILLALCFLIISCGSEPANNSCFQLSNFEGSVNVTADIFNWKNIPYYSKTFNINSRNILIINTTSGLRGFDLECPEKDCSQLLEFKNPVIQCPCSKKKYNYLQGGVPEDGKGCSLLMYDVKLIGTNLVVSLFN